MKNNDNLKEKEIKQEKSMDKKELESVSGGGYPGWFGYYHINPEICTGRFVGNLKMSCAVDCETACIHKAISWRWNDSCGKPYINIHCNNCGICAEKCPRLAISFISIFRPF